MICKICHTNHKPTSKHFPLVIRSKEGHPLGYICRKCVKKAKRKEIREKAMSIAFRKA